MDIAEFIGALRMLAANPYPHRASRIAPAFSFHSEPASEDHDEGE